METGDNSAKDLSKSSSPIVLTPPLFSSPHSALENSSPQQEVIVPSGSRPRKTKSIVWNHFTKLIINGQQKARCVHCQRIFGGNSKNGTSTLKDHLTRRCSIRFSQVASRQKLLISRKPDSTLSTIKLDSHGNYNDQAGLEHSPLHLDEEPERLMSSLDKTMEIVEEPIVGTPCPSPLCVDGGNQCVEQESGCLNSLVIKATYKEDTVRFDFSPTSSSVGELEKEVAKNLKLESGKLKIKYQDEDKEWMLMTMDSHLNYVLNLCKSSRSKIVRLLVSDL
ncbi:unnamed protein product [Amaranthus hypochondriacus]